MRRPSWRSAGNQKMPKKDRDDAHVQADQGEAPEGVGVGGCGVSNATGISTSNGIALLVKMRDAVRLALRPGVIDVNVVRVPRRGMVALGVTVNGMTASLMMTCAICQFLRDRCCGRAARSLRLRGRSARQSRFSTGAGDVEVQARRRCERKRQITPARRTIGMQEQDQGPEGEAFVAG